MRLLLFDVDGTLIHSNRAGRAALVYALEEIFGTAGPADSYQMAGKTDPLIITELLQAAGIPPAEVEPKLERVYELMARRGQTLFWERGIKPCAGVPALLDALQRRDDVLLGLVTGNARVTAPLKLAAAGLDPSQFRVGAFGSDDRDRNRLPALAMRRAAQLSGRSVNGADTVVVGDTPADVLSARAGGARAVAVATGGHSAATLAQTNPDHLLENLADTETVLQILLNDREDGSDG
ncbi:MAG: HAD hydrolase-like protein [Candidatus Promineifilaceae bacterium]|nr:HAD hydrolase-like protein [Candidatus Promineifilaceae bacterium]